MTQAELVTDLIREVLGPDVRPDIWYGTIMPYDAVYERRIVDADTYDWWIKAHRHNTLYHQRFGSGYCPRCLDS